MSDEPAFRDLPDLASRTLAGSVVYANDELFAARENLITPGPAVFSADSFGHKGKIYDGWETRRRRETGHDVAVVRLGVPGVVRGVVVDTSWFTGNYPPEVSIEATSVPGHPSPDEVLAAEWVPLVARAAVAGDTANPFAVGDERSFTHVRLSIYPDGGVARLRVHGEPAPDPRLLTGTVDLAAVEHGGRVLSCSDMFYGSAARLLHPDRARSMGDGWENARRRDEGNDYVSVGLGAAGVVRRVEIDTSYFVGNAPGSASLRATTPDGEVDLVPEARLQPDTRHLFRVHSTEPVEQVRLDVFPDGGVARLRVYGEAAAPAALLSAWLDRLPTPHLSYVLIRDAGLDPERAAVVLSGRPFGDGELPERLVSALLG